MALASSDWTVEVEPARPAQGNVPAAGPVYKATAARDGFPHLQDVSTCYELFQRSVKLYADRPCLGCRKIVHGQPQPYTYITYREAGDRVSQIGSAMNFVGVKPHTKVGVFGANSPEWMIAMQVHQLPSRAMQYPRRPDWPCSRSSCNHRVTHLSQLVTPLTKPV